MYSFLIKCFFLLVTAASLFAPPALSAQYEPGTDRGQGLVTDRPFWRQAMGGAVLSLPSVQAQSAVVALDGGNIRAYSTAGTPLWDFSARGKITPFVSRSPEGTTYFSRINGILFAVNRSGRELWRRSPGGPLCGRVIPGWDGRLFVPTDRKISCYTAAGTLLWSQTFEYGISIPPKLSHDGGIILALENNEALHIGAFGDTQKITLSGKPAFLLSVSMRGTLRILSIYADGRMEILAFTDEISANDEEKPAPIKLPQSPLAAVSMGNETAVLLNDGRFFFFSFGGEANSAEPLWSGDTHIREILKSGGRAETEAEMIFDERGIYTLSKSGASGFTKDGRRLWYTLLNNAAAVPAFGDDGVLYSGGVDWILYAFKLEDRKLQQRHTIYGPAADGVYGTGRILSELSMDFPLDELETISWLNQITRGINAGRIGKDELLWKSRLMTIAEGKFHIRHRITALELLGRIGSRETIPWLIGLFKTEDEPLIRVETAMAIGAIGVDPEGAAIRTFLETVTLSAKLDEQVILSIVSATGALCRFSGPPLSETGIRILNLLSMNNQPPIARRQAQRELASLK